MYLCSLYLPYLPVCPSVFFAMVLWRGATLIGVFPPQKKRGGIRLGGRFGVLGFICAFIPRTRGSEWSESWGMGHGAWSI